MFFCSKFCICHYLRGPPCPPVSQEERGACCQSLPFGFSSDHFSSRSYITTPRGVFQFVEDIAARSICFPSPPLYVQVTAGRPGTMELQKDAGEPRDVTVHGTSNPSGGHNLHCGSVHNPGAPCSDPNMLDSNALLTSGFQSTIHMKEGPLKFSGVQKLVSLTHPQSIAECLMRSGGGGGKRSWGSRGHQQTTVPSAGY